MKNRVWPALSERAPSVARWADQQPRSFFIGGGRRQIRGINDGHRLTPDRQERQELFDQVFIDGAQRRHPGALTELVKHSHNAKRRCLPAGWCSIRS